MFGYDVFGQRVHEPGANDRAIFCQSTVECNSANLVCNLRKRCKEASLRAPRLVFDLFSWAGTMKLFRRASFFSVPYLDCRYFASFSRGARCALRGPLFRTSGNMMTQPSKTVRTRFLIISDTHTANPFPSSDTDHAFRSPLPSADVLLHAGDITKVGYINEYESAIQMLSTASAELKLVIAGNHDITLDEKYYHETGKKRFHRNIAEDLDVVKDMWIGEDAKKAGIVYMEEGVKTFTLKNGATFTVYPSESIHEWRKEPQLWLMLIIYRSMHPPTNQNSVIGHFPMTVTRIASIHPLRRILSPHGPISISFSRTARQWESSTRPLEGKWSAASICSALSSDAGPGFTVSVIFTKAGELKG